MVLVIPISWYNGDFTVCADKRYLDEEVIYTFLTQESYWATDTTYERVKTSIGNSALCFGIYEGDPVVGNAKLIGFARVVSDLTTIAYLADGFVLKHYRGRGLFKWLLSIIVSHPELQEVRRFLLVTKDAQSLYAQFGFSPLGNDADYFLQVSKLKLD